jgi:hypothetical protein
MFGYRLVRDRDFETQRDHVGRLEGEIRKLYADVVRLTDAAGKSASIAAAKATMADLLTVEINLLRTEVAQYRFKATGMPQKTADIVHGEPRRSDTLAAGTDLFEDVGDEQAERLRQSGQLHDEIAPLETGGSAYAVGNLDAE